MSDKNTVKIILAQCGAAALIGVVIAIALIVDPVMVVAVAVISMAVMFAWDNRHVIAFSFGGDNAGSLPSYDRLTESQQATWLEQNEHASREATRENDAMEKFYSGQCFDDN